MRRTLSLAVVLLVASCGRQQDDAFAEAAPADPSAFTLELSGANEMALVAADGEAGVQKQGLHGEPPELLQKAREGIVWLNQNVRKAIEPIAELIAEGKSQMQPGDVRVWGPKDKGNATYRLTIKRQSADRFAWKLEAKAIGAADSEYELVAAGHLVKGERPHRGRGSIGIDFDTLRSIDTAIKAQGKVFCGFAHVGESKVLTYVLKGFTPDVAVHEPISAAFVGHKNDVTKVRRVRLATKFNLKDSPTEAKELVRMRARYIPGVGGRADALATGGDVPAGKAYLASACWDEKEHEGFAVLRLCTLGQLGSCQIVATRGQPSSCRAGLLEEELPPENENDTSSEPESPAVVEPVTEMPPAP